MLGSSEKPQARGTVVTRTDTKQQHTQTQLLPTCHHLAYIGILTMPFPTYTSAIHVLGSTGVITKETHAALYNRGRRIFQTSSGLFPLYMK